MRRRVGVANVRYNARPERVAHTLRELTRNHNPDLWVLVETKNVDIAAILGPDWTVHQGRTWDLSRRNAAVAWKRPDLIGGRRRFILGTLPLGHDLLTRWITRARLRLPWSPAFVGVDAMHLPPERDSALVPGYARQIYRHDRNAWKLWAGDGNKHGVLRTAADHYGMRTWTTGVMFIATNLDHVPNSFDAVHVDPFDHAVLFLDVEWPGR